MEKARLKANGDQMTLVIVESSSPSGDDRPHPGTGGSHSGSGGDPFKHKKQIYCPLCGKKVPMNRFSTDVKKDWDGMPTNIFATFACANCPASGKIHTEEVNRSYYENKIPHYYHMI